MTKQEIQERIEKAYDDSLTSFEGDKIFSRTKLVKNTLSLISEVVKDVIGEQEKYSPDEQPARINTRNILRSEQEAKRKELLGD